MVVTSQCNELILFDNWTYERVYDDPNPENSGPGSGFMCPLEGFNMETFPFIAWSRPNSINLVNLA